MNLPKTIGAAATLALAAAAAVLLRRRGRRGRRADAPRAGAPQGGDELTGRPLPASVAAFTPHVDAETLHHQGGPAEA